MSQSPHIQCDYILKSKIHLVFLHYCELDTSGRRRQVTGERTAANQQRISRPPPLPPPDVSLPVCDTNNKILSFFPLYFTRKYVNEKQFLLFECNQRFAKWSRAFTQEQFK